MNFDPADWDGTLVDRFHQWVDARHAFFAEHGEPVYAFGAPWNRWGDFLDMMNREGDVRREWHERLYGVPHYLDRPRP